MEGDSTFLFSKDYEVRMDNITPRYISLAYNDTLVFTHLDWNHHIQLVHMSMDGSMIWNWNLGSIKK